MDSNKKTINILVIILVIIAFFTFAFGVYVGKAYFSKNEVNNSNEPANNVVEQLENEESKSNEELEKAEEINLSDDDLENMIVRYLNIVNPLNSSCNDEIITPDCLDKNDILNTVLIQLDEDNKFADRKISKETDAEWYDYVSVKETQKYIKNMFGLNNYSLPNDYKEISGSCHSYTNLGDKIERFTNGPSCSFGTHGQTIVTEWNFYKNGITTYKNKIYVDVVGEYDYFDYTNGTNKRCTDETMEVCFDNMNMRETINDSRFRHYKYTFEYNNEHITLISIERV